jgi:hypothetical protein
VVKGRQEAFSKTVRDRTWSWFIDDFRTRFNKDAGLLAIGTRWHVDDVLGRDVPHCLSDCARNAICHFRHGQRFRASHV